MALYEKRMQQDLEHLKGQMRSMGDMAEQALQNAVHALLTGDHKLANETVLSDHPINRRMREIDRLSHAFIARHLPSAGHLRLISSMIRINIALERIGDYAVTISRESLLLTTPLSRPAAQEIETIASEVRLMLHEALTAIYDGNADAARATMKMSAHLEATLDGIYGNLIEDAYSSNDHDKFAIFAVLSQLKRVADQAKNLCEDALFALTGETKAKKVYNIFFVDEDNACLSQMAEAIARKNYPNSGHYASGGRSPAPGADSRMIRFMGEKGSDLERAMPKGLNFTRQELAKLHVIVGLQGDARGYVDAIPFHTAFLDWEVGRPPSTDNANPDARFAEIYRELSVHIGELMELLRGEGAD